MTDAPLTNEETFWQNAVAGLPTRDADAWAALLRQAMFDQNPYEFERILRQLLKVRPDGGPAHSDYDLLDVALAYGGAEQIEFDAAELSRTERIGIEQLVSQFRARISGRARKTTHRLRFSDTLRMKGKKKDAAIFRFLERIEPQLALTAWSELGVIKGDTVQDQTGSRRYISKLAGFHRNVPIGEQLSEGVYVFEPDPEAEAAARPTFVRARVLVPNIQYDLRETDLILSMPAYGRPRPLVAYAPPYVIGSEVVIRAHKPADLDTLEQEVLDLLVNVGARSQPKIVADDLVRRMKKASLNEEELFELCERLKTKNLLGEFFNLVQIEEFRAYLQETGLDWSYIYANWEPTATDSGMFWIGFMIGAGEVAIDALKMLYVLVGAEFSPELAKQREQMVEGIGKLVDHPITVMWEGLAALFQKIEDDLWELRYFESGRTLGNAITTILSLFLAPPVLLSKIRHALLKSARAQKLSKSAKALLRRIKVPSGAKALRMLDDAALKLHNLTKAMLLRMWDTGLAYIELGNQFLIRIAGGGFEGFAFATSGQATGLIPTSVFMQAVGDVASAGRRGTAAARRVAKKFKPKIVSWGVKEKAKLKNLIRKADPKNYKKYTNKERADAYEKLVQIAQTKRYGRDMHREVPTGETRLDVAGEGVISEAKAYLKKHLSDLSSGSREIQLWRQIEISIGNNSMWELVVVDGKLVGPILKKQLRALEADGLKWRISEFNPVTGRFKLLDQAGALKL